MTYQRNSNRYSNSEHERPDPRPLPPEVYRRRRIAALVIILVLVVLIVWGLTAWARSGSSDEGAEDSPAPTPTEEVTTEPTVPEPSDETTPESSSAAAETDPKATEPEKAQEKDPEKDPEKDAAAAGKSTCELPDLEISAETSKPSFAQGEQPVFYMEVKNPTKAPCDVNVDEQKLRFEVYDMAGNQRVWSDVDCYPPVVTGEQKFEPGDPRRFEARWSATGSRPGQCQNREPVAPGSYYLHAVIGDVASNPVDFTIR